MPISAADMAQILSETGAIKAIVNPERIRRDRTIDENFERGGSMREDVRSTLRSPHDLWWSMSGTVTTGLHKDGARRINAPSILTVIAANALTPPTGTLQVTLHRRPVNTSGFAATTVDLAFGGGSVDGFDTPNFALNAGDWVSIAVNSAGGAADVDVQITLIPL